MTERLSDGLRNWLLDGGSMRQAFEDCHMIIYSGPAPAEANDEVSGVPLVTITKANGAITSTLSLGETSQRNAWQLTLNGAHAAGDSAKIGITLNGGAKVTYTYLNTTDAGDANAVREEICKMLNNIPYLMAIPGQPADNLINVAAKVAGDVLVITDETGTNITVGVDETSIEARVDTIQFAVAASGAMSKSSDVWSGEVQTSGVAGHWRIVQPLDDGSHSHTAIRLQGSVSTSGAELNLSSTSLVDGTTLTIDTFSISLPAE
jgi:hypothetical protein